MAARNFVGLVVFMAVGMLLVTAQERKSYAELNAPFIFKSLEHLKLHSETKNLWDMKRNQMVQDLPETQGLYMIYYDLGKRQYPVFISSTGGTFRRALNDHYNREGGVLRTILEGKFPTNGKDFPLDGLKVKMIEMPKETESKLFERAYLETFYFALNDQETRPTRYELDNRNEVVKFQESKGIFNMQLKSLMSELETMYKDFEH